MTRFAAPIAEQIWDMKDFGLRAEFEVTPQFSVFGSGIHSNLSNGGGDANINTIAVGGLYDFGNSLSVFGGYRNTSVEDTNADLDTTSLGLNYGVNAGGMPIILSGEYARIDGDSLGSSAGTDRLSISATILFGGANAVQIPGNAVTSTILKTDRNAFSATLSSIGF